MPGGHHPSSPVEHRPEVVPVAQFGFTGRDPHPHRQLQLPLRGDRRVHRRPRRGKRGDHTIARVTEQEPVVRLNRRAQHLIVCEKRRPHRVRVGLPPTGRALNIGEQECHDPRRWSPLGHPHRMSQSPLQRGQSRPTFENPVTRLN